MSASIAERYPSPPNHADLFSNIHPHGERDAKFVDLFFKHLNRQWFHIFNEAEFRAAQRLPKKQQPLWYHCARLIAASIAARYVGEIDKSDRLANWASECSKQMFRDDSIPAARCFLALSLHYANMGDADQADITLVLVHNIIDKRGKQNVPEETRLHADVMRRTHWMEMAKLEVQKAMLEKQKSDLRREDFLAAPMRHRRQAVLTAVSEERKVNQGRPSRSAKNVPLDADPVWPRSDVRVEDVTGEADDHDDNDDSNQETNGNGHPPADAIDDSHVFGESATYTGAMLHMHRVCNDPKWINQQLLRRIKKTPTRPNHGYWQHLIKHIAERMDIPATDEALFALIPTAAEITKPSGTDPALDLTFLRLLERLTALQHAVFTKKTVARRFLSLVTELLQSYKHDTKTFVMLCIVQPIFMYYSGMPRARVLACANQATIAALQSQIIERFPNIHRAVTVLAEIHIEMNELSYAQLDMEILRRCSVRFPSAITFTYSLQEGIDIALRRRNMSKIARTLTKTSRETQRKLREEEDRAGLEGPVRLLDIVNQRSLETMRLMKMSSSSASSSSSSSATAAAAPSLSSSGLPSLPSLPSPVASSSSAVPTWPAQQEPMSVSGMADANEWCKSLLSPTTPIHHGLSMTPISGALSSPLLPNVSTPKLPDDTTTTTSETSSSSSSSSSSGSSSSSSSNTSSGGLTTLQQAADNNDPLNSWPDDMITDGLSIVPDLFHAGMPNDAAMMSSSTSAAAVEALASATPESLVQLGRKRKRSNSLDSLGLSIPEFLDVLKNNNNSNI
eukprot:TRINITY_DN67023_c6_g8_i1.p1 TRINITY_DN67023_c6_g8~~TRINITY_DN67023_c6_g8_i1.p1  ORF type:complete len:829 (-),score=419.91 TRINITY_DN67023_c6_g8_i1:105-2483(-)